MSLSIDPRQLALIDRAAARKGQERAAFILDAAVRDAEATPLDQCLFLLADEDYEQFVAKLKARPVANQALHDLLRHKGPWKT